MRIAGKLPQFSPKYVLFFYLLVLLLVLFLSAPAFSQDTGPAIVLSGCEIDYPPFSIVYEDGRADGFAIELMKAALEKIGLKATFRTGEWAEVRGWLERGEIDALPLVGRTPERERLFDFSVPYLTMHGAIVVREDTNDVSSLQDLKGRVVGVMKADNAEEFLRREDRGFEITTFPTFSDAFTALSKGTCDAVVIQRLVALRLIAESGLQNLRILEKPIMEFKQDFCFAVKEGDREMLALLNEGLALAVADGTQRRLHAKWFAHLQLPSNRSIVIGGDHNYPPFEYLDENGLPAGYNVDLAYAVAKAAGLDIRIKLGPWSEIVKDLENGEIDAIQGMFYSAEREQVFDFSQAHIVNNCVSVVRSSDGPPPSTVESLKDKHIIVQDGDIMHDFCIKNGLAENLTAVESQKDALLALSAGEYDCALVARMTALYWKDNEDLDNLIVGTETIVASDYCFAVKHGNQPLLSKLSEGLSSVAYSDEYHRIREKWMGIYEESPAWRAILRYIAFVAVPLLIIILIAAFWSWSLRKEVARRTAELEQQRTLLANAEAIAHIGSWEWNLAANELTLSDEMYNIIGLEHTPEAHNVSSHEKHYTPETWDRFNKAVETAQETGEPYEIELEMVREREPNRHAIARGAPLKDDNGNVIALRGTLQDVTTRVILQNQLSQAQKLESVGRLAGGVAHDFNNLLMGIMNYAELCREKMPADMQVREWLDEIISIAERSANLTRQLLAFARRQTIAPEVLDLNTTIEGTLKLLRRLIGEDIDLDWQPYQELWPVNLDPSQIDQILANLCVNARDAIGGVGKVTIETSNTSIDEEYCSSHVETSPGFYVMLAVSDDGHGMDRDTLSHIFEPFYTKKGIGGGTGLGLATVYGIVKQNNGFVNVYSEPGTGTTFRIYLPRFEGETTTSDTTADIKELPGGSETILLVEDERSVRVPTALFLEQRGYTVLSAETPQTALTAAAAHEGPIDIMITDVVMPGMSGRDLAVQLGKTHPDMKVLFISGYTANVIAHRGILEAEVEFLPKPFTRNQIVNKVRQILDS